MGIAKLKTLAWSAVLGFTLLGAGWMSEKAATRNDASILADLTSRVASDERFRNVRVEVANSVILLKGSVKLAQHKRDLLKMASETNQVKRVDDQVSVDTVWMPDRFLRKELYEKLHSQQLNEIGLKVKEGIVTVRGEVQTQTDRERVLTIISTTEGVRGVADRMTVRTRRQREHAPAFQQ